MKKIFISYRTADEPYAAALIDKGLSERFGSHVVFRASRSINLGEDFERSIFQAIRDSAAVLVVIGSDWLTARNSNGQGLDDPNDMVRREILEAFDHGVPVVPVLMNAPRIERSALPEALWHLAACQDVRFSFRNSEYDLPALIDRLLPVLGELDVEPDSRDEPDSESVTRCLLMIDIDGAQLNAHAGVRRRQLFAMVEEMLASTRIPADRVVTMGQGDGLLAVIDGTPLSILDPGLDTLITALDRFNLTVDPRDWLRLRVGIHHGFVRRDRHGWSGLPHSELLQLVDAAQVRAVLMRADHAQSAVVVSDAVYHGLIAPGPGSLNASAYAKLDDPPSWIRVPGYPIPPVTAEPESPDSRRLTGSGEVADHPVANFGNLFSHNHIEHVDASNHHHKGRP